MDIDYQSKNLDSKSETVLPSNLDGTMSVAIVSGLLLAAAAANDEPEEEAVPVLLVVLKLVVSGCHSYRTIHFIIWKCSIIAWPRISKSTYVIKCKWF